MTAVATTSSKVVTTSVAAFVVLGLLASCSADADPANGAGSATAPPTLPDGSTTTSATSAPTGDPALGPDLLRITGTLSGGTIRGVLDGTATLPLVLSVPSRGGGNGAVITPVDVGGSTSSLVWDGGRSLTLAGDGGVRLATDVFRVEAGAVVAVLGEAGHTLLPGTYTLTGPVAVGDGNGLARPSDATSFRAGDTTTLTATGAAAATLAEGELLLLGPGDLALDGDFTVVSADGTATATTVRAEAARFELTLRSGPEGAVAVELLVERGRTAA